MRDQEIPIVRLHRALSIEPDNHDISEGLIVVADVEGGPVGLLVTTSWLNSRLSSKASRPISASPRPVWRNHFR